MLSLTGTASVADYQAALRSVAYQNTSDDPSGADPHRLVHGQRRRARQQRRGRDRRRSRRSTTRPSSRLAADRWPIPKIRLPTAIDPSLTLTDLDNTTLASATVAITANHAGSEDRLVFVDQNGIRGHFDASTGVLSLSGIASIADYQSALRSVAYQNTSDDPSGLTRTVSFTVNDGALDSNVAAAAVDGDAGQRRARRRRLAADRWRIPRTRLPTAIDPSLTLTDLDNTTLASATVAITANHAGSEDRLVFVDQNGIRGHFDASTGVLSLSGIASIGDYQSALRSVAYQNTSDDPSGLTRTVSFSRQRRCAHQPDRPHRLSASRRSTMRRSPRPAAERSPTSRTRRRPRSTRR